MSIGIVGWRHQENVRTECTEEGGRKDDFGLERAMDQPYNEKGNSMQSDEVIGYRIVRRALWEKRKVEAKESMIEIRYVEARDQEFWYSLDKHLPEKELEKKIRDRQGYVILTDRNPVGLLRYQLFWDNTPFCTMLFVHEDYRRRGYGKMLMLHWENEMKAKGYGMVLTSTQVDEDAQHFYRKIGYRDCGGFVIDVKGYSQPMEMLMIKEIR